MVDANSDIQTECPDGPSPKRPRLRIRGSPDPSLSDSSNFVVHASPDEVLDEWCTSTSKTANNLSAEMVNTMPEGYAIVDSGAAMCCIGENAVARLAQSIEASGDNRTPAVKDQTQRFRFGGGETVEATFAVNLPVFIGGKETWLQSYVVPNESTPHLLSRRWLSQNKCSLCMDPVDPHITSPYFTEKIPLILHSSGHLLIPLLRNRTISQYYIGQDGEGEGQQEKDNLQEWYEQASSKPKITINKKLAKKVSMRTSTSTLSPSKA